MANVKITDLTALGANAATDDLLEITDISGPNVSRSCTAAQIVNRKLIGDAGLSTHNFIINGSFPVAQRGTSFTSATTTANSDDTYLLDRWVLLSDGDDVVDVTQGTDGAVGNGTYLQADVETINLKFGFLTILENASVQDLLSESEVVSVSFNARVSDATKLSRIKVMVLSWGSTADVVTSDIVSAWGVEGTSPTAVANWTIEGDSGDLNVTTTDTRFSLENVAINTSGVNNIGVFIWSDDVATNDTLGTLLQITDVRLEKGVVATDFEQREPQQELALCQRYYYKTFPQGTAPAQAAGRPGAIRYRTPVAGVVTQGIYIHFPVTMRASPAVVYYNPDSANTLWRSARAGGVDSGASSSDDARDVGIMTINAQASGDLVADQLMIHVTAAAEL